MTLRPSVAALLAGLFVFATAAQARVAPVAVAPPTGFGARVVPRVLGAVPAAVAIRPRAGTPDPKLMVLTSSDLGRAKVTKQRYYKDADFPSVISYGREFEGGTLGGTALANVESDAEVGTSADSTAAFLRAVKRVFGSKSGRAQIRKSFADEFSDDGIVSDLRIGWPRSLGVGADSFDLPITVSILGLHTELHISAFRVERLLGVLITAGDPGERISRAGIVRLARIVAGRMTAELAPKNITAPTIAGQPQVGQTLTATDGTWSGSPSSFAYQWRRCDSAGASCTDIPAATSSTYVLTEADVGSTMRVAVTARNGLGAATAVSAPTAIVSATGAPANTTPPTITGTPQVGQTLSASTGSWAGNPTSFSFQWQRCNAAATGCVDIPGATSGSYVIGSGDAGSTLRVAVTARNAVGQAAAVSATTSVVP